MGDVVPANRLVRARRQRALGALLPLLMDTRCSAVVMVRSLAAMEGSLRRMRAHWRRAADRHDAYQNLVARCQTAALIGDPEEIARLRDGILRDHAALRGSYGADGPEPCALSANDHTGVPT